MGLESRSFFSWPKVAAVVSAKLSDEDKRRMINAGQNQARMTAGDDALNWENHEVWGDLKQPGGSLQPA